MRPYSASLVYEGTIMIGSQVAKVVESKSSEYPVGTLVVGYFGWRNMTVVDPAEVPTLMKGFMQKLPDLGGLSPSLGLGALGMPGNTAFFGFLEICQPKPGDVVVVSGAAGAVGSIVGQIAKIKGCTVIGFAGSDDKVKWLVEELGFDKAYNDNPANPTMTPVVEPNMVFKQLKMEGFLVHRWVDRWLEGITSIIKWMFEGKIKVRETYTEGFEKMPEAFMGMMTGANTGKALIKA